MCSHTLSHTLSVEARDACREASWCQTCRSSQVKLLHLQGPVPGWLSAQPIAAKHLIYIHTRRASVQLLADLRSHTEQTAREKKRKSLVGSLREGTDALLLNSLSTPPALLFLSLDSPLLSTFSARGRPQVHGSRRFHCGPQGSRCTESSAGMQLKRSVHRTRIRGTGSKQNASVWSSLLLSFLPPSVALLTGVHSCSCSSPHSQSLSDSGLSA